MVKITGTREQILNAASALVLREGASHLTLERIAREAGISKGGLLYHFSAKEHLVEALIGRLVQEFDEDFRSYERNETEGAPGRRTRAFVNATLEGLWDRKVGLRPRGVEVFAALLAAMQADPALLEPLRRRYAEWQASFEQDGIAPERATVVRLAADGLWFSELFGLTVLPPGQQQRVIEEMLELTRTASEPETKRGQA